MINKKTILILRRILGSSYNVCAVVSALRGNDKTSEASWKVITILLRDYLHYSYGYSDISYTSKNVLLKRLHTLESYSHRCAGLSHYKKHLYYACLQIGFDVLRKYIDKKIGEDHDL